MHTEQNNIPQCNEDIREGSLHFPIYLLLLAEWKDKINRGRRREERTDKATGERVGLSFKVTAPIVLYFS